MFNKILIVVKGSLASCHDFNFCISTIAVLNKNIYRYPIYFIFYPFIMDTFDIFFQP